MEEKKIKQRANNPESIEIVKRFFAVLEALIARGDMRGYTTFSRIYGLNKGNFQFVRQHPESHMFQISWLALLVKDFGASANWLLTGRGEMFERGK